MKLLKMKILYSAFAVMLFSGSVFAARSTGADFEITKSLITGWGTSQTSSGDYSLAFAGGEPIAGVVHGVDPQVMSGYFGGTFGAATGLKLVRSKIGTRAFYQDTLQVGVPFNAEIDLEFSDSLAPGTIENGIQVWKLLNRLGQSQPTLTPMTTSYLSDTRTVHLAPANALESNALYEIRVTQDLLSVDGFTVETELRVRFVTLLEPALENVVLYPLIDSLGAALTAAGSVYNAGGLSVRIPPEALPELSMVLFNNDPLQHAGNTDPEIVKEATRKAAAANGAYRNPIKLQEVNAFNANGERISTLAKPADIAFSFQSENGHVKDSAAPVRPETLSLWTLDQKHKLWVKLPGSRPVENGLAIAAAVPHFSVYSLMGGPAGSAADVYAFPVPWRPYGPLAGDGDGQTGTIAGGITFSNLPSECTIHIYTLSGDRVRTLHHSDLAGSIAQERWDVRTAEGDAVASGVYLWRVESDVDGKNGKLMVIR